MAIAAMIPRIVTAANNSNNDMARRRAWLVPAGGALGLAAVAAALMVGVPQPTLATPTDIRIELEDPTTGRIYSRIAIKEDPK